jgi:hypothetical protein
MHDHGCCASQKPYFSRAHLPFPPLRLRLALAAAQMLAYHERFPPTAAALALNKALVDAAADELESTYRASVAREFVAATKALSNHTVASESGAPASQPGDDKTHHVQDAEATADVAEELLDDVRYPPMSQLPPR